MGMLFWRRFPYKLTIMPPNPPTEGCAATPRDGGERGGARSRAALGWHVDSNAHGGLGRRANGLAFGGKYRAATGARWTDRSKAGSHGGGLSSRLRAGRLREHIRQ